MQSINRATSGKRQHNTRAERRRRAKDTPVTVTFGVPDLPRAALPGGSPAVGAALTPVS